MSIFGSVNLGFQNLQKIDTDRLTQDVSNILSEAVGNLLEGAKDDVSAFVVRIANDLTNAVNINDADRRQACIDELLSQLEMVAELNRVRFVNESNAALKKIVETVGATLVTALGTSFRAVV